MYQAICNDNGCVINDKANPDFKENMGCNFIIKSDKIIFDISEDKVIRPPCDGPNCWEAEIKDGSVCLVANHDLEQLSDSQALSMGLGLIGGVGIGMMIIGGNIAMKIIKQMIAK